MLLTLVLAGCDNANSYPTDLEYPLRTDDIVDTPPKSKKDHAYPPGQLKLEIEKIPAEGGTLTSVTIKDASLRRGLRDVLDNAFGKPYRPRVMIDQSLPDAPKIEKQLAKLKLDRKSLDDGSKHYRRNCLHCHGLTGDGRGPTGAWVSPHPRDYRLGKFKFTSTGKDARPSRADLMRTVFHGLDGSTMPSFALLPEGDLENLVSYVIHLSLRGELEVFLMDQINKKGDITTEEEVARQAMPKLVELIQKWTDSNDTVIEPDAGWFPEKAEKKERDEEIKEGFKLFFNKDLNCAGCHIDFGRAAQFQYDNWGTLVRPNNLTAGIYRGGRRPIDFYWRIRSGILVMTAFPKGHPFKVEDIKDGKVVIKDGEPVTHTETLDDKKVGQLVRFIQALPYPAMLPEDIKEQVYGIKPILRGEKGAGHH